jgi:hypothetical protein
MKTHVIFAPETQNIVVSFRQEKADSSGFSIS